MDVVETQLDIPTMVTIRLFRISVCVCVCVRVRVCVCVWYIVVKIIVFLGFN